MKRVEVAATSQLRTLALAVCGAVLLASFGLVGAATSAEPRKLRDGFVVAAGSKLVGPVFPRIELANPAFRGWSGWTAVVDVVGEAGTVFDEYVTQARQHGFDVAYSDRSCREDATGDVACEGGANGLDTQFRLSLRTCTSCETPIAMATVQLLSADTRPIFNDALETDPPASTSNARLTSEMRRERQHALPRAGEIIPYRSELLRGSGPKSPLAVAPGAEAVLAAKVSCLELGGMTAVLRSDRSIDEVFDQYRKQIRRQSNNGSPTSARQTVRGTEVGAVNGSYANVSIVGSDDHTWVYAEECFAD